MLEKSEFHNKLKIFNGKSQDRKSGKSESLRNAEVDSQLKFRNLKVMKRFKTEVLKGYY